MSRQQAIQALDATGMLRQLGVPDDHACEPIRADRPAVLLKLKTFFDLKSSLLATFLLLLLSFLFLQMLLLLLSPRPPPTLPVTCSLGHHLQ